MYFTGSVCDDVGSVENVQNPLECTKRVQCNSGENEWGYVFATRCEDGTCWVGPDDSDCENVTITTSKFKAASFLAHLSTTWSRGAFRVVRCPSSIVRRQQFLSTSSPPKPLGQFEPNLAGMFLGRSSSKIVHRI